ncbi:hypothetical protein GHT06_018543 [Daphnia sinensis]|uniref:Uncharacterized protein n=1 Tax=Daphnia sinensis TaxID=1820382 RepID=A0AAD5L4D7_9CRUS|nr:hypothetical protein GHT06_018543 [Daphnia sinensis]
MSEQLDIPARYGKCFLGGLSIPNSPYRSDPTRSLQERIDGCVSWDSENELDHLLILVPIPISAFFGFLSKLLVSRLHLQIFTHFQRLITQNQADSTERATIQPRRRFLAGTVRAPQINHASPTVEPADNDNDPSAEAEITPVTSRPRPIVHVPRHLSADGDSPITPPSRRCTRRRQ